MKLHYALAFLILIAFTANISAQSKRKKETYTRPNDKVKVTCLVPPPDVMTTSNKTKVEAKIPDVVNILKKGGEIGGGLTREQAFERIREELSDLNVYEVMDYRLCVQYGNGVLSAEEYKEGAKELRPKPKASPDKPKPTIQKLEYKIHGVDDQAFITINGQPIEAFSKETDWKVVSSNLLSVGGNTLLIDVFNKDSTKGFFGKREGWKYDIEFRSGGKTWRFSRGEEEPPSERWGHRFSVESKQIVVEADGSIDIK